MINNLYNWLIQNSKSVFERSAHSVNVCNRSAKQQLNKAYLSQHWSTVPGNHLIHKHCVCSWSGNVTLWTSCDGVWRQMWKNVNQRAAIDPLTVSTVWADGRNRNTVIYEKKNVMTVIYLCTLKNKVSKWGFNSEKKEPWKNQEPFFKEQFSKYLFFLFVKNIFAL